MTARCRVALLHGEADPDARWLEPFVPDEARERYDLILVPRDEQLQSWHERGGRATLNEWRSAFRYARKAFAMRPRPDILVTTFPQAALAACVLKRLTGSPVKVVGWAFNLGSTDNAAKGRAAGLALRAADALIVHSTEEVERYRNWLGLPEGIVRFVPLQQGEIDVPTVTAEPPFAVAMGTARRDYATLFEAMAGQDLTLTVVAGASALAGLTPPPGTETLSGLSLHECRQINGRAQFSIVPIDNDVTASGQVTVLQSMALGVPVIATDCPGTRDYLTHEKDALIVPPRDVAALRAAIERMSGDTQLRQRLSEAATATWQARFSDPAAGRALLEVLDNAARKRVASAT